MAMPAIRVLSPRPANARDDKGGFPFVWRGEPKPKRERVPHFNFSLGLLDREHRKELMQKADAKPKATPRPTRMAKISPLTKIAVQLPCNPAWD